MRHLAVLACLFLVAACGQRTVDDPEPKLYYQAPASPNSGAGLAPKGPPTIDGKAIVVLRIRYEAPNDDVYKAVSARFTTQSIDTPYSGYVMRGESGIEGAHVIRYVSDENAFMAVAVEPGTYRYISAVIGDPDWLWPRFSPTRRLEFTVAAGEAVYVGDLKLHFSRQDMGRYEGTFGTRWEPLGNDYRFAVTQDEAAAQAFYDALGIENAPRLETRLMTNERMPNIEVFANPNCNGFFNPYYSSRGFCK